MRYVGCPSNRNYPPLNHRLAVYRYTPVGDPSDPTADPTADPIAAAAAADPAATTTAWPYTIVHFSIILVMK